MSTALITGASSGIGRALALEHAAAGGDLVIVARRRDRLEALAETIRERHGVSVRVECLDLGGDGAVDRLHEACRDLEIDWLVNNAGFGGLGRFDRQPLADSEAMIRLNVSVLTALCHRFVQPMIERGRGRILNVGSTAGFVPGPLQAVYYASKAYVNSFSLALGHELRDTGVSVTVLAPGPVATEFMEVASRPDYRARSFGPSAEAVARFAYRAANERRRMAIDDWRLRIVARVAGLMPRAWILALSRRFLEEKMKDGPP